MMWLHLFEVLSSDEKYKKLTILSGQNFISIFEIATSTKCQKIKQAMTTIAK